MLRKKTRPEPLLKWLWGAIKLGSIHFHITFLPTHILLNNVQLKIGLTQYILEFWLYFLFLSLIFIYKGE